MRAPRHIMTGAAVARGLAWRAGTGGAQTSAPTRDEIVSKLNRF